MVALDATVLAVLLDPQATVPRHPDTNAPLTNASDRISGLVDRLTAANHEILIPTPALSEVLVKVDAPQALLNRVKSEQIFRIEPFGIRAALEAAEMTRNAIESGGKRGKAKGPWSKVKVDRQIVAIAKVHGAKTIYSDDGDVRSLGEDSGIAVKRIADLPLPAASSQ